MDPETLKKVAEYARLAGKLLPNAIPELENALRIFLAQNGNDPSKAPSIRQAVQAVDAEIDAMLEQ